MRKRGPQLAGLVAALAIATMVSVAGQAPTALKTSWGEPDLQGIWDVVPFQIPLERPAKYVNQEFFTDAQRAELGQDSLGDARE